MELFKTQGGQGGRGTNGPVDIEMIIIYDHRLVCFDHPQFEALIMLDDMMQLKMSFCHMSADVRKHARRLVCFFCFASWK